jgi:hypothetical protein
VRARRRSCLSGLALPLSVECRGNSVRTTTRTGDSCITPWRASSYSVAGTAAAEGKGNRHATPRHARSSERAGVVSKLGPGLAWVHAGRAGQPGPVGQGVPSARARATSRRGHQMRAQAGPRGLQWQPLAARAPAAGSRPPGRRMMPALPPPIFRAAAETSYDGFANLGGSFPRRRCPRARRPLQLAVANGRVFASVGPPVCTARPSDRSGAFAPRAPG